MSSRLAPILIVGGMALIFGSIAFLHRRRRAAAPTATNQGASQAASIRPEVATPVPALSPMERPGYPEWAANRLRWASNVSFGFAAFFSAVALYGALTDKGPDTAGIVVVALLVAGVLAFNGTLLRKRNAGALPLSIICFLFLMLLFPVGTVFGILGVVWVLDGKGILKDPTPSGPAGAS